MIVESIIGIIGTIFDRVLPDKNREDKQKFLLEVQQELSKTDLMKAQIDVNKAEAENPNRKWITWRELLGYTIVVAIASQYVVFPYITYFAELLGHGPVAIPKFEILDLIYVLCGMLGIDSAGFIAGKVKNRFGSK